MYRNWIKAAIVVSCAGGGLVVSASAAPNAGALTVDVAGVRSNNGQVVVSLCREGEVFPAGCRTRAGARASKGMTKVTFRSVPAGTYAAAMFHDEDGDGKLTFMKEGIAFSNNSNLAFGPPKFKPASFKVQGAKSIKVNMKYFG